MHEKPTVHDDVMLSGIESSRCVSNMNGVGPMNGGGETWPKFLPILFFQDGLRRFASDGGSGIIIPDVIS